MLRGFYQDRDNAIVFIQNEKSKLYARCCEFIERIKFQVATRSSIQAEELEKYHCEMANLKRMFADAEAGLESLRREKSKSDNEIEEQMNELIVKQNIIDFQEIENEHEDLHFLIAIW